MSEKLVDEAFYVYVMVVFVVLAIVVVTVFTPLPWYTKAPMVLIFVGGAIFVTLTTFDYFREQHG